MARPPSLEELKEFYRALNMKGAVYLLDVSAFFSNEKKDCWLYTCLFTDDHNKKQLFLDVGFMDYGSVPDCCYPPVDALADMRDFIKTATSKERAAFDTNLKTQADMLLRIERCSSPSELIH